MQDYIYKIEAHPKEGLGFVAKAYDERGKHKWTSVNHCAIELCRTEINRHKAWRRGLWQNAKSIEPNKYKWGDD